MNDIEAELITKSLLFMSLLDGDLDLVFRKKIANYIAGYLAVYTSKSKEYANCKNQQEKEAKARLILNGVFTKWIDGVEATKKNRRAKSRSVLLLQKRSLPGAMRSFLILKQKTTPGRTATMFRFAC